MNMNVGHILEAFYLMKCILKDTKTHYSLTTSDYGQRTSIYRSIYLHMYVLRHYTEYYMPVHAWLPE